MGHDAPAVYRFGDPAAPVALCERHLIERIRRGTWPKPPRTLKGFW